MTKAKAAPADISMEPEAVVDVDFAALIPPEIEVPALLEIEIPMELQVEADAASGALMLEPVLDLRAAAPLARSLSELRGSPVEIDASQVQRLGGLCLQVLLSAQATWRADGAPLTITNPAPAFTDALKVFGAPLDVAA